MEDADFMRLGRRKRLPHEWEWQLAAQELDGQEKRFPWGNGDDLTNVPA